METKTAYKADALTQSDLDEGLALLKGEPDTPPTKEEADTMFMLFLKWEHATRDTIDFKKIYVDMADDLIAGLLLSQLVYWYLPDEHGNSKLRIYRDGHWWIAKQRGDWYDEIRISAKQYDRAVSILEEKGLVYTDNFRFDGMRTVHIRLDESALMQAWQLEIKRQKVAVLPKGEDRSSPKVNSGLTQRGRPLTETTTENTTEINKESRASAATLTPLAIEDNYRLTYYVKDRDHVTPVNKTSAGPWRVTCDCSNTVTLTAIGEVVECRKCGMHEFILTDARPGPAVKDATPILASARVATAPPGRNGSSRPRPSRQDGTVSAMLMALASATRIDLTILPKSRRAQLQAEANRIEKGGYTIEEVKAAGAYWWGDDWRGRKGSPPTDAQFTEMLGRIRNGKERAIEDEWKDCIGRPEPSIF